MTCNHDTIRPRYTLTENELKLAYAFIFTMPGVPFLYYGDEIGLNYIPDLPTKEGGYTRTGSRTPMQWSEGVNAGFSEAEPDKLYLPVQYDKEDVPVVSVERAMKDDNSLYNTVKSIISLRHKEKDLRADSSFCVICSEKEKAFVYGRGDMVIVVNPRKESVSVSKEASDIIIGMKAVFAIREGELMADGAGETETVNGNIGPQTLMIYKKTDGI